MKLSEKQIDRILNKSDKKSEAYKKYGIRHRDWISFDGFSWRIRNPYFGILLDEFKTSYKAKLHRLKYLIENNEL